MSTLEGKKKGIMKSESGFSDAELEVFALL